MNNDYLQVLSGTDLAPKSVETYDKYLTILSGWLEAERLQLIELSERDFRRFARSREWRPETAHICQMAIRRYLRELEIEEHAVFDFTIRRPKHRAHRVLTESQRDELLRSLNMHRVSHKQLAVILMTLWDTWLRASEIANLKVSELDLARRKLTTITKGNILEKKVYSKITAAYLSAWLIERPHQSARTVFFNTRTGEPLTRHGLGTNLRKLGARIGLELSPHDFRHGGATHAIRSGIPTRVVMAQGGWEDHRQVERYTASIEPEDFARFFDEEEMGQRVSGSLPR